MFTHITSFTTTNKAADIHFSTGLCKREITWPEAHFEIFPKHFLHKEIQCLLQISKGNIFCYIQTLYLVKETMRPGTDGFVAVYPARADNPNGQFAFLHLPYL